MEKKIFVTSDTHFWHNREFLWQPRGFNSVLEMNKEIINRWNSVVRYDDEVYLLGDLMLNNNDEGMRCLRQLNGNIHIILGNHDTDTRVDLYRDARYNIDVIGYATIIKYKGYHFYLSHYPTLTSNLDADKPLKARILNICGHSHTQDPFADWDKGYIFHAELDTNNCYPWLLDDIIEKIKEKIN